MVMTTSMMMKMGPRHEGRDAWGLLSLSYFHFSSSFSFFLFLFISSLSSYTCFFLVARVDASPLDPNSSAKEVIEQLGRDAWSLLLSLLSTPVATYLLFAALFVASLLVQMLCQKDGPKIMLYDTAHEQVSRMMMMLLLLFLLFLVLRRMKRRGKEWRGFLVKIAPMIEKRVCFRQCV